MTSPYDKALANYNSGGSRQQPSTTRYTITLTQDERDALLNWAYGLKSVREETVRDLVFRKLAKK